MRTGKSDAVAAVTAGEIAEIAGTASNIDAGAAGAVAEGADSTSTTVAGGVGRDSLSLPVHNYGAWEPYKAGANHVGSRVTASHLGPAHSDETALTADTVSSNHRVCNGQANTAITMKAVF